MYIHRVSSDHHHHLSSLVSLSPSHRNIFQAQKSFPQEMMDILADLGCGGGEHVMFITHLYLNVGMDKWFPMMKNHFALDDDVLLLLVRTMKGQ